MSNDMKVSHELFRQLLKLPRSLTVAFLALSDMSGADNRVALYSELRREYALRLGVSIQQVNRLVYDMQKAGLIRRVAHGIYFINPYIVNKAIPGKLGKLKKSWRELVERDKEGDKVYVLKRASNDR